MDIKRSRLAVPLEIVEEILFRLPVKSLVRLRCVSKAWRGLINDSVFIERHLVHSRNNHPGIVIESNYYHYQKRLYILCQSWCPNGTSDPEHYFRVIQCSDSDRMYTLNHHSSSSCDEPQRNPFAVCVLGSCDGLLFLASFPVKSTFLWWFYNPSTRKFKRLPIPNTVVPPESNHDEIYGFGYNATSKDYQVVRVVKFYYKKEDTLYFQGEVYSLKNNSWREIQVPHIIHPELFLGHVGVFLNGAIHWAVKHDNSTNRCGIIAFCFATDEFFVLPLPNFITNELCTILQLVVLGGCLCLICVYSSYFEGWMMREYGVKESWTKFFEATGDARFKAVKSEALLFEAHNIFAHSSYLHYYKSEDTSIMRLPVPLPLYPGSIVFATSYVESLVPLG